MCQESFSARFANVPSLAAGWQQPAVVMASAWSPHQRQAAVPLFIMKGQGQVVVVVVVVMLPLVLQRRTKRITGLAQEAHS